MKRALMGLLLAVWVIGGAIAVWAQEDPFYGGKTGCDVGVLQSIEGVSPNVDYAAVCERYLACAAAGRDINVCQFEVTGRLLEACAVEDVQCRNVALLHVAALTVYSWPPGSLASCGEEDSFPLAMYYAGLGDYAAALDWLNESENIAFCQPMIQYATGLIEEMASDQDAALEAYSASVEVSGGYMTPALYSRGLLLGEMGRTTEASFDGEQLQRFLSVAAPDVLPAMAPLIEGYPLDRSDFTTWMAYPVATMTYSPGGTYLVDETLAPAFPFEMAEYPDLGRLAVLDFSGTKLSQLNLISGPAVSGEYRISSLIEGPVFDRTYVGESFAIRANDDLMIAVRSASGFEVGSNSTYFVAPPDAPDPRTGMGTRTCEGGVLSILQPGIPVEPTDFSWLYLQAEPGGQDWMVERQSYAYLSGDPICLGSDAWWFATAPDGQTGWLPENQGEYYELTQSDLYGFSWMLCPGAPLSRLIIGYSARVLDEPGAGEMRAEPGNDTALVTTLSPGETVEVGYERACVDGQVRWRVTTEDGQSGYMPEGDSDTYFLELVTEDAP